MRKTFSIALSLLLVFATAGVTINRHYSGGELFSVALYGDADNCCEVPCDCCHDESETLKVEDDFISSGIEIVKVYVIEFYNEIFDALFNDLISIEQKLLIYGNDKSPPLIPSGEEHTQIFLL